MGDALGRAQARKELGQIDFPLDQLARAVERGEVRRASHDVMAPSYLARRAEVVRVLIGEPAVPEPEWLPHEEAGEEVLPSVAAEQPRPAPRAAKSPKPVRHRGERQRQFIGETRARLTDSFENWR
ncbi:MAG: hypothetical protein P4L93_05155 [Coriobacteriia bacterium]|nr:hypothetical protein [Coriobacteriia bacterium]